jgi:hypothetical protein
MELERLVPLCLGPILLVMLPLPSFERADDLVHSSYEDAGNLTERDSARSWWKAELKM